MKKYIYLVLSVLVFCGVHQFANADDAIKEINTEEFLKLKKEIKNLAIVDARGVDAFDGIAVQGAKNLSVRDTDEKSLSAISADKNAPIVFYCGDYRCVSSSKSALIAEHLGYKNIYKYTGGIAEWKKQGLPTDTIAKKE